MQKKKHHAWNSPLLWTGVAIYAALLLLFGWQTWQFVNWLFPDDQLLAKILTMISFDVLAAFWAVVHTFYRFASRGAKVWIIIAWGLTFALSLVASVLYLVIQFYFRFHLGVSDVMVNFGYAVSIIALVFNILALMAWLILEYQARNPRHDEFEDEEEIPVPPQQYRVIPDSTPVPSAVTGEFRAIPAIGDPEKLLDLINKGVRYGQLTEEEARPLRLALRSSPTSQSQNGNK